jgi:hypothetical protein
MGTLYRLLQKFIEQERDGGQVEKALVSLLRRITRFASYGAARAKSKLNRDK